MDLQKMKRSIEEDKIEELKDIVRQREPEVVLSALCEVEGGKNLVMQAVAMKRFDMALVMVDMLEGCVTSTTHKIWTSDEYAEYLCSLDDNGNNLLQLTIIHGPRNSDMMPQRVITLIKTHNQKRLRDLVNNKNSEDKDSHDLANEHKLDKCFIGELLIYGGSSEENGNMRAVIFINKEHDNELNAKKLDDVLRSRGFYVKHLNHTDWDRTSLCMELGKHTNGNFEHLWVFGLTHGRHKQILDRDYDSIEIKEIVQKISEANATHIVIIIDACQTIDSDDSDTDNDSDNNAAATEGEGTADGLLANQDGLLANQSNAQPAHEGPVPQGEPHLLITCSRGQKAWGDTFVSPLVEYLYTDETDMYTILELATREAEEKSKIKEEQATRDAENSNETNETSEMSETSETGEIGKTRKRKNKIIFGQTVQFPPDLAEGDITLPKPTNEDQIA